MIVDILKNISALFNISIKIEGAKQRTQNILLSYIRYKVQYSESSGEQYSKEKKEAERYSSDAETHHKKNKIQIIY